MKKYLALLGILAIVSSASENIFTNTKINLNINISQNFLQNKSLNDWSDNGYDFKIAKEKYVLNLNSLPRNIIDQIQIDEKNNQKSFSEDALDLKYLNDEQRKTFFWVEDNQIQNSKGEVVKWWDKDDKHFGTKISVTNQQIDQVKNALTYEKKKLQDGGWYQNKSSKSSWNFYKEKLGHFLDVTKITDGDTMKFSGLTGLNLLEPSTTKTIAQSDNVRALVMDTDETLWSRYNSHKNEENADKYLPTRLGYVQKAVAQIAGEIYQNQKWLIVPVSADKYNRTLSLIFTPDGIPWHKFLCECYCAGIYKNENQIPVFKTRNNYLMIQWWIIDFWLDRASIIPSPKEKEYETDSISNNDILFEKDYRTLAHDWLKVKISYDIFWNMINIYKNKNYSEMQNYFYIIIQSFPKLDNTGAGGSILQSDIEMAVKVICDNFLEISKFYENQELSHGLLIVTNIIGSWDKNDGMGVFGQ